MLWRSLMPMVGGFGTNYSAVLISKVNKSTLNESNCKLEVMTEAAETKKEETDGKKVVHTYPLVRHCDMVEEMKTEAMELCVTACEKHAANNENAARMIKEAMDRKFGPSWHVVVGEGYGFEISYECRHLLYMFFGGNMAICTWKCS